jgi:hypothetical protein
MKTYLLITCISFLVACGIAVLSFYEAYCVRASRSERVLELRSLIVKSMKLSGAFFLLLIVFIGSQALCDYFQLGFWISFGISILIAVVFWRFFVLFNIKHPASLDESE